MKITVHLERQDTIPIAEWEQFLAQGRRAGASDSALVADEYDERHPDMSHGWMIEVEQTTPAHRPENVTLPTRLLHNLLYVATQVANSDGDVRGLVEPAKETVDQVNEHYRRIPLGPNPWRSEDED